MFSTVNIDSFLQLIIEKLLTTSFIIFVIFRLNILVLISVTVKKISWMIFFYFYIFKKSMGVVDGYLSPLLEL